VFPLICPTCQVPLTFIAFLTDPEPITQILAHIGEPTSPPLIHPPRGPPQTELAMGRAGAEAEEAAQGSFPDDLDQTPQFDPASRNPCLTMTSIRAHTGRQVAPLLPARSAEGMPATIETPTPSNPSPLQFPSRVHLHPVTLPLPRTIPPGKSPKNSYP
jgi:hypothetical protein